MKTSGAALLRGEERKADGLNAKPPALADFCGLYGCVTEFQGRGRTKTAIHQVHVGLQANLKSLLLVEAPPDFVHKVTHYSKLLLLCCSTPTDTTTNIKAII